MTKDILYFTANSNQRPFIETGLIAASEVTYLFSHKVHFVQPHILGGLFAAGVHGLSIAAIKRLFPTNLKEHSFYSLVVAVAALSLNIAVLPYLSPTLAMHAAIALRFEVIVRTAAMHAILKTVTSALAYFCEEAIVSLTEKEEITDDQFLKVQSYFKAYLNSKRLLTLKQQMRFGLPLGQCSQVGRPWTKAELSSLTEQVYDCLNGAQKKELNQLYFDHQLPPLISTFSSDELPTFPENAGLSIEQLRWAYLTATFSSQNVSQVLAHQFYDQKMFAPRSTYLSLPEPYSFSRLEEWEKSWHVNFYVAHQEKWQALSFKKQQQLMPPAHLPLHPKTVKEVSQLRESDLLFYASSKGQAIATKWSLSLRRALSNRLEEKLGDKISFLFQPHETRRSLLHRVTSHFSTKQVLSVALIGLTILRATVFDSSAPPSQHEVCAALQNNRSLEDLTPYVCEREGPNWPAVVSYPPTCDASQMVFPNSFSAIPATNEQLDYCHKPFNQSLCEINHDLPLQTQCYSWEATEDALSLNRSRMSSFMNTNRQNPASVVVSESQDEWKSASYLNTARALFLIVVSLIGRKVFFTKPTHNFKPETPLPKEHEDGAPGGLNNEAEELVVPETPLPKESRDSASGGLNGEAEELVVPKTPAEKQHNGTAQKVMGSLVKEDHFSSSSDEGSSQDLSAPVPHGQAPQSAAERGYLDSARSSWIRWFGENNHPAKLRKYEVVLEEIRRALKDNRLDERDVNKKTNDLRQKYPNSTLYQSLHLAANALFNLNKDAREQRKEFLKHLRDAITDPEYQAFQMMQSRDITQDQRDCRSIIWKLTEAIFSPEIHTYLQNVVEDFTGESNIEVSAENFSEKVTGLNEKIEKADKGEQGKSSLSLTKQKLQGSTSTIDYIGTQNTPHCRSKMTWEKGSKKRTVHYIRHGVPLMPIRKREALKNFAWGAYAWLRGEEAEGKSGEIAPEYEEWLVAKRMRGEGHLYVNHQRRFPTPGDDERPRVKEVEKLGRRHPNVFVMTQAVEGPFFKHEGEYEKKATFKELKEVFIASFNVEDEPEKGIYTQNRLPELFWESDTANLRESYLQERLREKLDFVHKTFFNNRDNIEGDTEYPLRDWQTFIELGYAFMKMDLIVYLSEVKSGTKQYPITSLNTTCKDFLDRGGNEALILDVLTAYMLGDLSDEMFKQTLFNLLAPPILVKKKEVIPKRIKPGLAIIELLCRLPDEIKEGLKNIDFDGWKIKQVQITKRPGQEIACIHKMKTEKEVLDHLETMKLCDWVPCDGVVLANINSHTTHLGADSVKKQVQRDLKTVDITLDGKSDASADEIYTLLSQQLGELEATQLMSFLHQGLLSDLVTNMSAIFDHPDLSLNMLQNGAKGKISLQTKDDHFVITGAQNFSYINTNDERRTPKAKYDAFLEVILPKEDLKHGHARWWFSKCEGSASR